MRSRVYAVQVGEGDPEVSAVAAPIVDGLGLSAFAVSIVVPTSRFSEARAGELGAAVIDCAAQIAVALPW